MNKKEHSTQTNRPLPENVAPALRMLAGKDGNYPVVAFKDGENSISGSRFEQKLKAAGLRGKYLKISANMNQACEELKNALENEKIDVLGVENLGIFCLGSSKYDADNISGCFESEDKYYCREILDKTNTGRLSGKIVIVTGSAQGFGEGIAKKLADEGAYVVIADLNYDLAVKVADEINKENRTIAAKAVKVDVSNEESVKDMIKDCVLSFGGLDIFVNNAGVLKAGGLEEMTLKDFEFVTKVNYTAYFLCAKYASGPMKIQSCADPEKWSDIIQINSKSGLEGSNKNFAYAGGKFGGIGLTQSFALELVEDNIKVNSICPGNYYEGPLWSDPENGLFVQYLRAGKVPGASTIEDVKDFYLSKSPIKRGCSPEDVTKAIIYCTEQTYETGQAIPVTGGQKMLH